MQQRFDINRMEKCLSVADRAWRNGKGTDCFTGRMRKYLEEVESRNRLSKVVAKVHAKNCYIFTTEGTLITVFSIADRYDKYMRDRKPQRYYEAA